MSAGITIVGRDITLSFGGGTLVGVVSKNRTFNNTKIDTTDDNSSGWVESAAQAGLKSLEYSFGGKLKNLELVAAYFGTSQIFEVIETFPDGSTLTYDVFLDSISQTGESNDGVTFEASVSSTGAVVFVAGV